jgi:hypothetical protein
MYIFIINGLNIISLIWILILSAQRLNIYLIYRTFPLLIWLDTKSWFICSATIKKILKGVKVQAKNSKYCLVNPKKLFDQMSNIWIETSQHVMKKNCSPWMNLTEAQSYGSNKHISFWITTVCLIAQNSLLWNEVHCSCGNFILERPIQTIINFLNVLSTPSLIRLTMMSSTCIDLDEKRINNHYFFFYVIIKWI